jgi:hypothetical protein
VLPLSSDPFFKNLIVQKPHPLLSYGIFFPFPYLPALQRFSSRKLSYNLHSLAYDYLSKRLVIQDDYNFIILAKHVKWYSRDLLHHEQPKTKHRNKVAYSKDEDGETTNTHVIMLKTLD